MELATKVVLKPGAWQIAHNRKLLAIGSCFANHIGNRLAEAKFDCDINPFGILYNPASIATELHYLIENRLLTAHDLKYNASLWCSILHHGSFSATTQEDCLEAINSRLSHAAQRLPQTDWLLLTWGTAWVYRWKENGQVVGNCHKFKADCFERRMLSPDEIAASYTTLCSRLRTISPQLKILITVSPIRHLKDGLHENQLSKSVLLLAADKLCSQLADCFYFPAYEIMIDELRDYRFYADDLVHPSTLAVQYIWERFADVSFTSETRELIKEIEAVRKAVTHRPLHPDNPTYKIFVSKTLLKINRLNEKFPFLDLKNEEEICRVQLKK